MAIFSISRFGIFLPSTRAEKLNKIRNQPLICIPVFAFLLCHSMIDYRPISLLSLLVMVMTYFSPLNHLAQAAGNANNIYLPFFSNAQIVVITYYVDCNGSDQNSDKSASLAWRTLKKPEVQRSILGTGSYSSAAVRLPDRCEPGGSGLLH
jgi:hypothetical protein